MVHTLRFVKASGAGNDFVLIDGREGAMPADTPALARALCSRHFGVGGDGLLLIRPSSSAHFLMEYYNADGSYGGMCGNGGRCIARYALLEGIAASPVRFEALGHVYEAVVQGALVRLSMQDPVGYRPDPAPGTLKEGESAGFINTGSPHLVVLVRDTGSMDVFTRGHAIRHHEAFKPEGTNVNFVQVTSPTSIVMRTYERGVEAETLACGTGSVASALVSSIAGLTRPPITVRTRGGEDLVVDFTGEAAHARRVTLEGSAHMLFEGTVRYDGSTESVAGVFPDP